MPSVKLPKKSTDTDMTPFVDIAFLILTFFIMATKFKPPEPVEITTPNSVSSQPLPENDAVRIDIDKDNKVYFTVYSEKDPSVFDKIMTNLNTGRNLGLGPAEIQNFRKTAAVGVPFSSLKSLLALPADKHKDVNQPGIPVMDSATNELVWWIAEAQKAFAGKKLTYLVKGDSKSKFPTFEAVINALKRNEVFKYNLITMPEDVPATSDLARKNRGQTQVAQPAAK
jgi:biopolymer transport protein ExbD